jgi:hypothetical protein
MYYKIEIAMSKNVLKIVMALLLVVFSMPFVNAQVHVGDILCEDDRVVSPTIFSSEDNGAIAVVFYVDGSGKHGWAVALHDSGNFAWGPNCYNSPLRDCTQLSNATANLDGYKNTGVILENRSDHPAFNVLDYENGWYLPAAGQLKRLYSKIDKVNASLSTVGGDELFPEDPNWECWSSTEYNVASAWYMNASGALRFKDQTYNGTKDARRVVRGVINF